MTRFRGAYRGVLRHPEFTSGRQVQAVALVFAALVDILEIRPWELIESIRRVVDDEAGLPQQRRYKHI